MHRRHEKRNIPIELARALVTIVDTGSFTRAADALNLTQPAVSAQIARLGRLLGGNIFAKGPGNMALTDRGAMILQSARRLIAINDELLALAGPNAGPRRFMIGFPAWLGHQRHMEIFARCSASAPSERVGFHCDRTERLIGDLDTGAIDVAYLCSAVDPSRDAIARWTEQLIWVKSPRLKLPPGGPIPLIGWPGTAGDRVGGELLRESGMRFYVSFSAPDYSARLSGVVAGLGVMAVPAQVVTAEMEIIREGLPKLPENKSGIFARVGLDLRRYAPLLKTLTEVLMPKPQVSEPGLDDHTSARKQIFVPAEDV
jgi:DNA-binding transcriptional LysR family regulator